VPQVVIFGDQAFHDDGELDTAEFLKKLKASPALPKTAAPEPTLYHPIFSKARDQGEGVIVVAPSGKISGTMRSAQTAAQDFPGMDIRIVDTLTVSCNLGALVLWPTRWPSRPDTEQIIARVGLIPAGTLFVVDTAGIWRGGRIGAPRRCSAVIQVNHPADPQRAGGSLNSSAPQSAPERLVEIVEPPEVEAAHLAVLQVAARGRNSSLPI
jgi:DegV family protein with EDD domain